MFNRLRHLAGLMLFVLAIPAVAQDTPDATPQPASTAQQNAEQPDQAPEPEPQPRARASRDDGVVTINATVTGNQEQPKVLYIVPWKDAQDRTILEQQLNSRLDTVFNHVERREHLRQLDMLGELHSEPQENE